MSSPIVFQWLKSRGECLSSSRNDLLLTKELFNYCWTLGDWKEERLLSSNKGGVASGLKHKSTLYSTLQFGWELDWGKELRVLQAIHLSQAGLGEPFLFRRLKTEVKLQTKATWIIDFLSMNFPIQSVDPTHVNISVIVKVDVAQSCICAGFAGGPACYSTDPEFGSSGWLWFDHRARRGTKTGSAHGQSAGGTIPQCRLCLAWCQIARL